MNVANDFMSQRGRLRIYETLEELGCSEEELMNPDPVDNPETRLLSNEVMRVCMYGFTESLPLKQKKAFFLVVGMDLSHKVAAEIMECSVGTLKVRLHRAKRTLAAYIEKRCSLINKSSRCRCERWIDACMSHGRITNDFVSNPTTQITVPDRVNLYLRDVRDIYADVYHARTDEAMAEMLKQGFEKRRWATFA